LSGFKTRELPSDVFLLYIDVYHCDIKEKNKIRKASVYVVLEVDLQGNKDIFETVPKIHIVILSEAKNLIFSFQVKKSKKRDPSDFVLRMAQKDKFTKILEHSQIYLDFTHFSIVKIKQTG
jgi:guanylate kinase